MNTKALHVIALGRFPEPVPPLSYRLAQLGVMPQMCDSLDYLPGRLEGHEILLTDLDWLRGLGLSPVELAAVCGGNARVLYDLPMG